MAKEIKPVECAANVYTALSSSHDNVSFTPPLIYGGRMAWNTSVPDPDTADYRELEGGKDVNLGSMSGMNVYFKPNGNTPQTIQVMRS